MIHPNEVKETTCVYDYIDDEWTVYSCVPKHITKLNKFATPYWIEKRRRSHFRCHVEANEQTSKICYGNEANERTKGSATKECASCTPINYVKQLYILISK